MKNNFKKMGIGTLVLVAALGIGAIGKGCVAEAATVGQRLEQPESGWTRYNDTDANITYSSTYKYYPRNQSNIYMGDYHHNSNTVGSTIKFGFHGTKLRIISWKLGDCSGANVNIDGVNCGNFSDYSTTSGAGCYLFFEKLNLVNSLHEVVITSLDKSVIAPSASSNYFALDAIDVESNSKLEKYSSTVAVKSIALNKTSDTLEVGDVDQLTATVNPSNATNKNVTWTSSNPKVATVDKNGKVNAVAEGNAVITVQAAGSNVKASCNVKVNKKNLVKDNNLKKLINNTLGRDENLPLGKEELVKVNALLGDNKDIKSLEGLQYCTNLEWMYLPNNPISDLTPLKDLKKLNTLFIYGSKISDISPLANLTQLDSLSIANSSISDISALKKLTNLKSLYLNNNKISDISVLKDHTALEKVSVDYNNIKDISALKNLTNLTELGVNNNQVSDISAVAGLTKLTYLGLSNNKINNVKPLANLTNLSTLYLVGNNITDFSPIESNLKNIKNVDVSAQHTK